MKTKYFFLTLGIVILIVVAISWFAFPWRNTTGGFWLLIVTAAAGVVSIAKDVIAMQKDLIPPDKTTPQPTPGQTQLVEDSDDVDQDQQGRNAPQQQTVKHSTHVTQRQR